ncbi:hypothetical protein EJD97_015566, partial [Solanum chilense]
WEDGGKSKYKKKGIVPASYFTSFISIGGYSLFLIAQEREISKSLDFTTMHLSNIFFLLQERKEHHIIGYTIQKHRSVGLGPLFIGQWNLYAQNPDSSSHLFGTAEGAGMTILTLLVGFHPQTQNL